MNLTPEHLRASYEIYMQYGNSSSATIISVLNKLRETEGKEHIVACAFGPGIALEMMVLRRRKEASSASNGVAQNGANGVLDHNGEELPNGAVNGNHVAHMNGGSDGKEGLPQKNGNPTINGTTNGDASPAAEESAVNGSFATGNDGQLVEANGSDPILPVEDLD